MTLPIIAATRPKIVALDAGTYYWCACGRSSNQPFCDGSHAGTAFEPTPFTLETGKRVALCACKRTGKGPFCDGSHARLEAGVEP